MMRRWVIVLTTVSCMSGGCMTKPLSVSFDLGGNTVSKKAWLEIYGESFSRPEGLLLDPIVVICNDGTVVRSLGSSHGGPPYAFGQADTRAIAEFRERVEVVVRERSWGTRTNYLAPDASHIVMKGYVNHGYMELRSWHDLLEQDETVVATERGSEPLNGRKRSDVLAGQSEDIRLFRKAWDSIKNGALSLPLTNTRTIQSAHID